jgi:uncharacterized protein (DUF1778 family)
MPAAPASPDGRSALEVRLKYHDRYQKIQTRVTDEERNLILQAATTYGLSMRDWLVTMARRCVAERLPESQGGLKVAVDGRNVVVDFDAVRAGIDACERESEHWRRLAEQSMDPVERQARSRTAGVYLDAMMWLETLIDARRRRLAVLESGQRSPRLRSKGARPTLSAQASGALLR